MWTTATKAVKRFVEIGLVDPVEPFGPNRQGALRLLCYDLLVTDAIPAVREMLAEGRELATETRSTRANRAHSRPIRADVARVTCENRRSRGGEVARSWRGEGSPRTFAERQTNAKLTKATCPRAIFDERQSSDDSERDAGVLRIQGRLAATCAHPDCSESIAGHTYSDHEPLTAKLERGLELARRERPQ